MEVEGASCACTHQDDLSEAGTEGVGCHAACGEWAAYLRRDRRGGEDHTMPIVARSHPSIRESMDPWACGGHARSCMSSWQHLLYQQSLLASFFGGRPFDR